MLTWYLLSPSWTIINEVFGGILPRFSATITSVCSGFSESSLRFTDIGVVDNRLLTTIGFPSMYTEIVSPSISPLSYKRTTISSFVTVNVCVNSFVRDLIVLGITILGFSTGLVKTVCSDVFLLAVSVFGFTTAGALVTTVFLGGVGVLTGG